MTGPSAAVGVSGTIRGEATWRGIVRLAGEALVAEGATLTIAPGTRVVIEPSDKGLSALTVLGTLKAEGAPESEVIFFPEAEWGGIIFAGRSAGSELKHVWVDGVRGDLLTCRDQAEVSLAQARLRHGANAIRCAGSSRARLNGVTVTDQKFVGVLAEDESEVVLKDSLLGQNATGLTALGKSRVKVSGCRFAANSVCGINAMMKSRVEVFRNRFEENHTAVSACAEARVNARENIVSRNRIGIHVSQDSRANVWGNIFELNELQDVDAIDAAEVHGRSRMELADF